jgi:hypothetical protein
MEEEERRHGVGEDTEEQEEGELGACDPQGSRAGDREVHEEDHGAAEGADLGDGCGTQPRLDLCLRDAAIESEEERRDEVHHGTDRLRARRRGLYDDRAERLDRVGSAQRERSAR